MDQLKGALGSLGGGNNNEGGQGGQGGQGGLGNLLGGLGGNNSGQGGSGNVLGGLGDKLNAAAGGGKESEKDEDLLDKGVDFVQEKFLKQGPQDNESAVEQAKDEKISDFIRDKYKSTTGKDFPIADKPTKF